MGLRNEFSTPEDDFLATARAERNAQMLAQQEATDKPIPRTYDGSTKPTNMEGATEADYAQSAPQSFRPPGPDAPMYDGNGQITAAGRQQLEAHGAKVAPVAPSPDTTPVLTHPQASAPAVPPGMIGPPPPPPLRAQFGGAPDLYKNERAALDVAKGRGLDRSMAESLVKDDRDQAFGEVRGEQERYAKELADREPQRDAKRAELEGERQKATEAAKGNAVDEYLKSQTGGQKALGLIAAAAGGFLQGFRGLARNPGLDAINEDIDRHVAEARRGKDAAVAGTREAYERFLDDTKSKDAASAYTHAALLDGVRTKLDQAAANEHDLDRRYNIQDQSDTIARESARLKDRAAADASRAAAAFAAANSPDAKLARELKLREQVADIDLKEANAGKARNEAGAGAKLTDEQKAQREVDANVAAIESAKDPKALTQITRGTSGGAFAAEHLPGWMPGVMGAREAVNDRENYNNRVRTSIAAAYKLSTDATEPKNIALIEQYAGPYELTASDDENSALPKMNNLESFIKESGVAKGANAAPPLRDQFGPGSAMPPGFQKVAGT